MKNLLNQPQGPESRKWSSDSVTFDTFKKTLLNHKLQAFISYYRVFYQSAEEEI